MIALTDAVGRLLTDWRTLYVVAQILYFASFLSIGYLLSRPVNWVSRDMGADKRVETLPLIVMAYPVLREDFATMHSTLVSLSRIDYPKSRYRVIAIPNSDDRQSIEHLHRLRTEFPFLEILEVPPPSDPLWNFVWAAWSRNSKAYWYHSGRTAGSRELPPKKTRQLIYLLYSLIAEIGTGWVLDYIDADSIPPQDHFRCAAAGLDHFDVLQATNVSGNLLDSMAASLHSFDHMCWDGKIYAHMSANGTHPYYVLGKGLFYRASDLYALGGFNPWITIEDPEVGMRLWTNGRRLGIIAAPLIEEVPRTFYRGIIQRNRWMCGFFQSLASPLKRMGMPFWRRMQARINIIPVLSHPINVIGLPTGVYALYLLIIGANELPMFVVVLSVVNIVLYVLTMTTFYRNAWQRTKFVLNRMPLRIWYMLRINPIMVFLYEILWVVPLSIGFAMFLGDRGKVWVRTRKYDADHRFAENLPDLSKPEIHLDVSEVERRRQEDVKSKSHKVT